MRSHGDAQPRDGGGRLAAAASLSGPQRSLDDSTVMTLGALKLQDSPAAMITVSLAVTRRDRRAAGPAAGRDSTSAWTLRWLAGPGPAAPAARAPAASELSSGWQSRSRWSPRVLASVIRHPAAGRHTAGGRGRLRRVSAGCLEWTHCQPEPARPGRLSPRRAAGPFKITGMPGPCHDDDRRPHPVNQFRVSATRSQWHRASDRAGSSMMERCIST